jgi:hypothetical protein
MEEQHHSRLHMTRKPLASACRQPGKPPKRSDAATLHRGGRRWFVTKTCLPSSWSPLTEVMTSGMLRALAIISRHIRGSRARTRGRGEHRSRTRSRGLSACRDLSHPRLWYRPISHLGRCSPSPVGWTALLNPILCRARYRQFARPTDSLRANRGYVWLAITCTVFAWAIADDMANYKPLARWRS